MKLNRPFAYVNKIVHEAHTTQDVLEALQQAITETRIPLDARCPACAGELSVIAALNDRHTDVRCLNCQQSVFFFQSCDEKNTQKRRIYIRCNTAQRDVLDIDLRCLSCEQKIDAEALCQNRCEIQTFLVLEAEENHLYVQRDFVRYLYRDPRPVTEIPICEPLRDRDTQSRRDIPVPTDASQTPHAPVEQPNTNTKKDIEAQILTFLPQDGTPMRLKVILANTDGNRKNTDGALQRLIKKKKVKKVNHGWYARRM